MKRLRLGAILHFIIAIGHLGCLFALDEAFDAYGIKDVMYNMVFGHVWMLYAITVGRVLCSLSLWQHPEAPTDSHGHYCNRCALQSSFLGRRLGLCDGFQFASIFLVRHSSLYRVVLLSRP